MKASSFLDQYAFTDRATWESAVVDMAKRGELYPIKWVSVPVEGGGRRGTIYVSEDVVSLGEPGDAMRMPLTASAAQSVANTMGALLPTRKIAALVNRAGQTRLSPITYWPNPGPELRSFAKHSVAIDKQIEALGSPSGLLVGHKKDLIVSNKTGAGREAIYGWYSQKDLPGIPLYSDSYGGRYIQPLSDVHDDAYVDYSHGIRLVHGSANVEGAGDVATEMLYMDPAYAELVSDEGPIRKPRYSAQLGVSQASRGGSSASAVSLLSSAKGLLRVWLEGMRAESMMMKKRSGAT